MREGRRWAPKHKTKVVVRARDFARSSERIQFHQASNSAITVWLWDALGKLRPVVIPATHLMQVVPWIDEDSQGQSAEEAEEEEGLSKAAASDEKLASARETVPQPSLASSALLLWPPPRPSPVRTCRLRPLRRQVCVLPTGHG